jgi:hypothetical protein
MLVPGASSAALIVSSWFAQAEAAPGETPPPVSAPAEPAPAPPSEPEPEETPLRSINAVAVYGRLAIRPTGSADQIPREGFSLGGTFDHRYAIVNRVFAFAAGLDFFFDHFSSSGTQNSFVALQSVALERVPLRPWVAAGAGLAVAGDTRAVVRGALGVELAFTRTNAIAVRADLTHALSGAGAFVDLFDVGVGLLQRF